MAGTQEVITFDLRQQQRAIVLTDKEGQDHPHTIRELSGRDMEKYLEDNSERIETAVEDGKVKVVAIKGYEGMYTSLLQRTLYNAEGVRVPTGEIDEFPHSVQKQLFTMAQELNGMLVDEDDKGKSGNSPTGTESGSD